VKRFLGSWFVDSHDGFLLVFVVVCIIVVLVSGDWARLP